MLMQDAEHNLGRRLGEESDKKTRVKDRQHLVSRWKKKTRRNRRQPAMGPLVP
jgi:hypothetical protein